MKNIRMFAVATLFPFAVAAFEPLQDLRGSEAVAQGQCPHEGITYACFIVKKEDKLFMVVVDAEGILLVYSVKEIKRDYAGDDATMIWRREPARRRNDLT